MKDFILIIIGLLAVVCGLLCCIILINEIKGIWEEIKEYKELNNGKD